MASEMKTPVSREKAKDFLHQNLLEIIDLRRTSIEELNGSSLRPKVESLVNRCLKTVFKDQPLSEDRSLIEEIVDEAIGLGPIEKLLRDDAVTEIMVNGPKKIYIERSGILEQTNLSFVNETSLRTIIDRIVTPIGRRIDESSPMVDARLPDGSRVNAVIPPLSLNGTTLTIRKFSKTPLSMERMITYGSVSPKLCEFLRFCVQRRKNILIAGGTGSGKTTLLNALSAFIPGNERIITIEDAAELKLPQEHVVSLEARPNNTEGKGMIPIRDLVKNALRMRPDRIVVGECRGGEALDMLQAMNTGHEGSMTTAHANSTRDALLRLETMVLMAGFDLPIAAIREQIASAIDIIVFQSRMPNGRRAVQQVTEICGREDSTIVTQDLFTFNKDSGELTTTSLHPRFALSLSEKNRNELIQILNRPERNER